MLDLDYSLLLCSCEICSVMEKIICLQVKVLLLLLQEKKKRKKPLLEVTYSNQHLTYPSMDSYTSDGQRDCSTARDFCPEQLSGVWVCVCVGGCEWQQDHPRDPTESEQFWIPARTAQETDKGCPRSMQNQWQLTHLCPFFISFGDCLNTNLAVSEQSDSLASKRIFCHPDTSSQWHSWCSCSNVSCVSATRIVQKSA